MKNYFGKDKYNFRAEKINKTVTIHCPNHGFRKTYDLAIDDTCMAIGCESCFEKLPIKALKYNK